ncbi:MAG: helix-turn-helix domain-containing protein [Polyangiaceae bacterium]
MNSSAPPPSSGRTPPVSTVAEAAKYLRVNPKTLYAEIAAGRIHALRFGRTLRIPRAVLEALCAGTHSPGRGDGGR